MGKKINLKDSGVLNKILSILYSKKVVMQQDNMNGIMLISLDISKADLGNKTWGYLDLLEKEAGFFIIGRADYIRKCQKMSTPINPVMINKVSKKEVDKNYNVIKHSYDDIPAKSSEGYKYSEFTRRLEINHFCTKFVRGLPSNTNTKKKHRREIAKAKKAIEIPFAGETIFTGERLVPLRQLTQREKKLRSIR